MRRTFSFGLSVTLLTISLHGCALIQSESQVTQTVENAPLRSMVELQALETAMLTPNTTLDPKQIQPGQIVEVATGTSQTFPDGIVMLTTNGTMAGRVKEVPGDRVVLSDVIVINEYRVQQGVPIVDKIPYVSRLFKNTGMARSGIPIPGEVSINKSEILHAKELTEAEFLATPKDRGHERIGVDFQRIGVDFDFNVESENSGPDSAISVSR